MDIGTQLDAEWEEFTARNSWLNEYKNLHKNTETTSTLKPNNEEIYNILREIQDSLGPYLEAVQLDQPKFIVKDVSTNNSLVMWGCQPCNSVVQKEYFFQLDAATKLSDEEKAFWYRLAEFIDHEILFAPVLALILSTKGIYCTCSQLQTKALSFLPVLRMQTEMYTDAQNRSRHKTKDVQMTSFLSHHDGVRTSLGLRFKVGDVDLLQLYANAGKPSTESNVLKRDIQYKTTKTAVDPIFQLFLWEKKLRRIQDSKCDFMKTVQSLLHKYKIKQD